MILKMNPSPEVCEKLEKLKGGMLLRYMLLLLAAMLLFGTLVRFVTKNLGASVVGESWHFRPALLIEGTTWLVGLAIVALFLAIYTINGGFRGMGGTALLGGKGEGDRVEGSLENSRFLTEQERDKYFPTFTYETLKDAKNDGVPARAVLDRRGKLVGNWKSGVHALVIGATGSGKTTTFINPMIQCIAATNCGSSMIMTDPKGELFDLHSGFLKERAYVDVTVESEAYDPVAKRIEEVRAQVQADLRRRQQEVEGGEST